MTNAFQTKTVPRRKRGTVEPAPLPPGVETTLMTTREAAAYLRVSRQFLELARWKADGSGPPYVRLGHSVRYDRPLLDQWLGANICNRTTANERGRR